MNRIIILAVFVAFAAFSAFAQSESAYEAGDGTVSDDASPGLLDPSRLKISHALSFMAGGSQMSNVKSQSMYSTMMQYKFNAPVVLSLNFDMPLHSTFNRYGNLNRDNLESLDYFKNMPIDASISWFPTDNFMMRVSVMKGAESGYYNSPLGFARSPFYRGW